MSSTRPLTRGARITLDASGGGTVRIGPDGSGGQTWHVTSVLLKSNRPGQAPIPRAEIWQDSQDENHAQGLTYDGSFASGTCDLTMSRGSELIIEWTGGQSGDICTVTIGGEQS